MHDLITVLLQGLILACAFAVTLGLSGVVVRYFVLPSGTKGTWPPRDGREEPPGGWPRFDPSTVIGKCENIITLSFVLTGNYAGLALIFAGKSLVRTEAIKNNPGFYLGGTLVNLVWGLLIGLVARGLLSLTW